MRVNTTNSVTLSIEDMNVKGYFSEFDLFKMKDPDVYLPEKVLKREELKKYQSR